MATEQLIQSESGRQSEGSLPSRIPRPSRLAAYGWFIGKNVLGWLLIVGSWITGLLSPIPIGFFLFLLGFGLIWFPGKRRLTARILRGKPVPAESRVFRAGLAFVAVVLPTLLIVYLVKVFHVHYELTPLAVVLLGLVYIGATGLTLFFGLPTILLANRALAMVPPARRRARPWLRRHGIELLPPRPRLPRPAAGEPTPRNTNEQIIQIDQRHQQAAWSAWSKVQKWARRIGGLLITIAIFAWILKPVLKNWDQVKDRIGQTDWTRVLLASAMFATFLFMFRALSWRRILIGFGHRVPVAPATRIWSASELARYLPGVIWQVLGRVYLVRPYGVPAEACSTSQILELTIFLLANVLLAVGCLAWLGFKVMHQTAPLLPLEVSLLAPVLLTLLHPRVFYGATNAVLRRLGRKPIEQRLKFRVLLGLLGWAMLGLLWQSLAIWVMTSGPLHLQFTKWWVVAGPYCLAWCAGFLAFWAQAGLGVREAVFVAAMQVALPPRVREQFADPKVLLGVLAFLSLLLRFWTIAGELMLAGVFSLADLDGFLGRPTAPGRIGKSGDSLRPR